MKYGWCTTYHLLRLCETQASPKVIKKECCFGGHLCIYQMFAGVYHTVTSLNLACRASLNHPCPWDSPCWHNCSQLSPKEFASSVQASLKTGLCHGSNKSSTEKSLGWVHLSKKQTSDINDVLKAPSVLDRGPDAWKGMVSELDGIDLPWDCFSLSIDQDNLKTAGLSQVHKEKKK